MLVLHGAGGRKGPFDSGPAGDGGVTGWGESALWACSSVVLYCDASSDFALPSSSGFNYLKSIHSSSMVPGAQHDLHTGAVAG